MLLSEQINGKTEDLIFRFRNLIKEFSKIQDAYYLELQEKTGIRGKPEEDFLWDYCYNCDEPVEFSEYLKQFGH